MTTASKVSAEDAANAIQAALDDEPQGLSGAKDGVHAMEILRLRRDWNENISAVATPYLLRALLAERAELIAEAAEQSRIIGMGAERELALQAKVQEQALQILSLDGRCVELMQDAARYRWLRDEGRCNDFSVVQERPGWAETHSASSLDAAVDAAIAAQQEKRG